MNPGTVFESFTKAASGLSNAFADRRRRAVAATAFAALLFGILWIGGSLLNEPATTIRLAERDRPPSFAHPFGTDWLGRDMFARTLAGLALSVRIGLLGAACSVILAAALGFAATWNKTADRIVSWLIDLFLGMPHLVALILIAFVCGGGMQGIVIGVTLTHWPTLARIVRAEALQLKTAEFVQISRRLGRSRLWIATRHLLPHLAPQLLVGFLLLFPHAVLHEASITFLGLGLSPHRPAVGIILSESMRYLSTGMWWLTFFPGLSLLAVVAVFDRLGNLVRTVTAPQSAQASDDAPARH